MRLKELINKSWYCSIGYIETNENIQTFQSYLSYNYPVLKEYKGHIFVFTYKELELTTLETTINSILPDAKIILIPENRGHSFGIADSENAIVDYCKENNIDWICKSSNDVIFNESILEKEIGEADFYYLNGIGFGGMVKYNFDNQKIIKEDFYPQTNFYFINLNKIDYLYDKDYVNSTYYFIQNLENYSGRVWEHIEGWTCEDFLKNCVNRNNLSKEHLVPQEKYIILLEHIKRNQVHDCSHKNIMIEGICHFQYPDQQVLVI